MEKYFGWCFNVSFVEIFAIVGAIASRLTAPSRHLPKKRHVRSSSSLLHVISFYDWKKIMGACVAGIVCLPLNRRRWGESLRMFLCACAYMREPSDAPVCVCACVCVCVCVILAHVTACRWLSKWGSILVTVFVRTCISVRARVSEWCVFQVPVALIPALVDFCSES